MIIDLTLNELKFPALNNFIPLFGKKKDKGSLITEEICVNSALPFSHQRGVVVTANSTTTTIEHDSKIVFPSTLSKVVSLTLGQPAYEGLKLTFFNFSDKNQTVVSNDGTQSISIMAGDSDYALVWNGTKWIERSNGGFVFPIGYVFISTEDVNPQTYIRGTRWESLGESTMGTPETTVYLWKRNR